MNFAFKELERYPKSEQVEAKIELQSKRQTNSVKGHLGKKISMRMKVTMCFLSCTIVLLVILESVATSNTAAGDNDIDDEIFGDHLTRGSQLRKSELAVKLITLGEMLLKQSRENVLLTKQNPAGQKIEKEKNLLRKLFGRIRNSRREISSRLRQISHKEKGELHSSKRSAARCRCRTGTGAPICWCDDD